MTKPKALGLVAILCAFLAACSTPTAEPTPTPRARASATAPRAQPLAPATSTLEAASTLTIESTPTLAPMRTTTATPTAAATPTLLGDCAEIFQPGYYIVTQDIKTKAKRFNCMIVQSSDVVIDCDNHSIEGLSYGGYGFWIRKYNFPFVLTPANVEIRNCRVFHHRTGVFAEAGSSIYIHDNNFSGNLTDVDGRRYGIFLGMTEGGGIRLDNVQGARLENNTTNDGAIGVDIRNSDRVIVRNHTAVNNTAWGVTLINTTNSEVSNNAIRDTVRYCTWGNGTVERGCDAAAIALQDGASHNVVKNNTITGQNANGIFIKAHGTRCGDDNLIQSNKIIDAIYNAVEFSFCKDNKVIGNEMSGSYDAVFFGFSTNTEVRANTIRNMRNHGIISYNSNTSQVTENQIAASREGIFFYWDDSYARDPQRFYFLTPPPDRYASRNNAITNNTLRDNSVAGIHLLDSIQNRVTGNVFANNAKNIWMEGKTDGNTIAGK